MNELEEIMDKKELRDGLKRLEAYGRQNELKCVFLEEGKDVSMDSLVFALRREEDMSIDISCNFVSVPDCGSILQFFGQLELAGIRGENPDAFTELNMTRLVNMLNRMIPMGQMLYMQDEENGEMKDAIGIRYTMFTELDQETEYQKCMTIFKLLMDDYELLCSMLYLLTDGESLDSAMQIVTNLMAEG